MTWANVLRSFVRQSKKRTNVDGSPKLIVFCMQSRRCTKQCKECLHFRSELRFIQSGLATPDVIYLGDGEMEKGNYNKSGVDLPPRCLV